MQLNDHTDLGLRILVLLGSCHGERVSSQEIAKRHRLSHTHVQKVIQNLQMAGFVETHRGRHGGVELAREADDISIGEVVRALEPNVHIVRCLRPGRSGCVLDGGCALTGVMARATAALFEELDQATLGEIVTASPYARKLTRRRN